MKVSIVLPVHNDAQDLVLCIKNMASGLELYRETKDFELIIVDDHSSDGTPVLADGLASADSRILPVRAVNEPGYGIAVKSGLKKASGDIIVTADPDNDPGDIRSLVAKIEEGYDIAYGSQCFKGRSSKSMLADRLSNGSIKLLFGIRHNDVTNTLKAYRKAVIDRIGVDRIEAMDANISMEIALKAYVLGFKSVEVPVSYGDHREAGHGARNVFRFMGRLLKLFIEGNLISLKDIFGSVMKGSLVFIIIATLIGLLLLAAVFSIAGFAQVLSILSHVAPVYILACCVMIMMTYVLRTWRICVLLKTSGHPAHPGMVLKCYFFGFFVNFLLPVGLGDFARAFALKTTEDVPISVCLPAFMVEGTMDMLALAGMLVVALMLIPGAGGLLDLVWFALFLSFGMVMGLVLIYKFDHVIGRITDRFKPLQNVVGTVKKVLGLMIRNPAPIVLSFILTVAVWVFEILSIFFASKAVNVDVSVALTSLAGIASFIAEAVPITPAGIGIHEGAIAGALYLFGISISAGTSIALVDHFARGLVTYAFGIPSMVHIGFESRGFFASNGRLTNAEILEADGGK